MDSLITAAARALAAGDPIGALNRVALRDDAPALALRGIAMAQLGDLVRAKALLRRAARTFGPREVVARARCTVAEAEIALVSRDIGSQANRNRLESARAVLGAHGDRVNAAHAGLLEVRRLLLVGRLDEAERTIATIPPGPLPATLRVAHDLAVAGIAIRRLRTKPARAALGRADRAAREAAIPALTAEVEAARRTLETPAARLIRHGEQRPLRLQDVERLLATDALVVDACRYVVRQGATVVSFTTRPVLFALVRLLGEAWPGEAPRDALIGRAFGSTLTDESHRARLRVEAGRLRQAMRPLAAVAATARGFALTPRRGREVVVLARPIEEEHAAVLALLADGEAWSSSALAVAAGASQRTLQRALESLAAAGKVQPIGHGRGRRWTAAPVPGFTTTMLLPAPLPIG